VRNRYLSLCALSLPNSSLRQQNLVEPLPSTLTRHLTHYATMNNNMNNNKPANAGGEDYLDKAFDKMEQMAGKKVCASLSQTYTK
jgi:hypothetical protein